MSSEVVVFPVRKFALDIVLLLCVAVPVLCLFLWGVPFHRGFFCDDEDLIHPFHQSTVPSVFLYVFGILTNCIAIILIEYLNQPHSNREITFLGCVIPNWIHNVYCGMLVFAFGLACSQLTTDIMKYSVGRLRPHFHTVCIPNVNCSDPNSSKMYHVDFICTNSLYVNNKRIMKELRLSFPSGHSSFSMFTMLHLAIYLQRRMNWDGSRLLRLTLQFFAVIAALFTAMTRISDYKHHWSDVLGGLLIGTTIAVVVACDFTKFGHKIKIEQGEDYHPI